MKFMVLADIHQMANKWKLLIKEVQEERPDIVAISGDLLPKCNGILRQMEFVPSIRKYAQKIKDHGAELVLILGNDDNQLFIPHMEQGDKDGLWHYISDRVKIIKGYEFCGCPWVRDYPFVYKYWVVRDIPENIGIDPNQFGAPVLVNDNNRFENIDDLKVYFLGKPSIWDSLQNMAQQVKDMPNSIWLIHGPPAHMQGMDLCAHGARVGSSAVYQFLSENQPLLSIHGHIHEAPEYNGKVWAKYLDRTLCIQAGQLGRDIYYVTFDLENGKIQNLTHSIYGKYQHS